MCKVKSGRALENLQDVQNLVVGIINRQQRRYVLDDIYNAVMYHFQGAQIDISQDTLFDIIDDNLSFAYRKGMVDCRGGYYFPRNILASQK